MKKYRSGYFFRICSETVSSLVLMLMMSCLVSCKSALYNPEITNDMDESAFAGMQQGRKLYIRKCGSCHTLYLPEKYSGVQWQNWLDKMAPKGKLDTREKDLILKYVRKGQ